MSPTVHPWCCSSLWVWIMVQPTWGLHSKSNLGVPKVQVLQTCPVGTYPHSEVTFQHRCMEKALLNESVMATVMGWNDDWQLGQWHGCCQDARIQAALNFCSGFSFAWNISQSALFWHGDWCLPTFYCHLFKWISACPLPHKNFMWVGTKYSAICK